MNQLPYWLFASLLLVCAVLYVGIRAYRIFLTRFERERRNVQQMSELHLATIEALARAIEAKDGTEVNYIHSVQLYGTAIGCAIGL